MTKDCDSQANGTQNNSPSPSEVTIASRETAVEITATAPILQTSTISPLEFVTSTVSEPVYRSTPSPRHYFTAEVRKRSPYDFIMVARDPFHYLHSELPLSCEEDQEGGKRNFSLVCQFPTVCDDALVDFIEEDEDLLGMVLISFHMQILNDLFLFCAARKAKNLIMRTTEEQLEALGIYQDFIKYVDKIPTKKGIAMEVTIPVHSKSLKQCNELIDKITSQFRQTLWRDQSSNPTIRDYLKANVRLSIIA